MWEIPKYYNMQLASGIFMIRKSKNKIKRSSKTIKNVSFVKGCDLSTEINRIFIKTAFIISWIVFFFTETTVQWKWVLLSSLGSHRGNRGKLQLWLQNERSAWAVGYLLSIFLRVGPLTRAPRVNHHHSFSRTPIARASPNRVQ